MEKKSKYKTIVKFENGTEIKADLMSYVLFMPPRTYWYYTSLDSVFSDLLTLRIKELASSDSRHTLQSLADSINKAKAEIELVMGQLTSPRSSAQSRSEAQEKHRKHTND